MFVPDYEEYRRKMSKLREILVDVTKSIPVIFLIQPSVVDSEMESLEVYRYNAIALEILK